MVDSADNSGDALSAGLVAEFVAFASEIANDAGIGIAARFRDRAFVVEDKDDGTPVTNADREAESLLRGRIAGRYPDHGIIGEELGEEGGDREFVWILDPIDGTKSFVHGVPLFGTLVGLLHRGRPVVGLIHQPILGRLAVGDNRRAWLNGKPARVRAPRPMEDATFLLTDPADPRLRALGAPFAEMLGEAAVVRSWGDCFGYL
ncbi:MAG: inositol monophosphatase family protein, partial [Puniceicoccaceae bacterium]